jgi:3-deoxy-D-manno-octulosonate 8-phosphate phosphatase (KDO 8-P phosphatase)
MLDPARVRAIHALVCDVDGVLTDGSVFYGDNDVELKAFNIKDGLGMRLAGWSGLPVYWLTGRCSPVVERRAAELGVTVRQGVQEKGRGLRALAADAGLALDEIAYIGDDLNDAPALRLAGLPVAVADAVSDIQALAVYVTRAPGGRGAVRELIELLLRGQGRWEAAQAAFFAHLEGAQNGQ